MIRKSNSQEDICKDRYILMKNSREEFAEINKGYIKNIDYSFSEPNVMELEIPNTINVNGKNKIEPLYDKFLGKRQYINVNNKERYVVTECERTEDSTGKKVKIIKAEGSEITLNDFELYIGSGGFARKLCLVENDIDISEGILDLALAETSWKVGTVTDKARLNMDKILETYYKELYKPLSLKAIKPDMVLWEKDFTDLKPIVDNVLQVNISYKNIKSYIGGQLQKDETIVHKLGNLSSGVKKIKATYSGNDEYRWAIKYDITLENNLSVVRWCEFTYLDGMDITIEDITMNYTNGTEVVANSMKIRNFDEGVYSIYDFLKQVEQAFEIKIIFDNFNKTISCYDYSEVGEDTSLVLSYDNFVKSINKNHQYDNIISKLNVESELASISEENPTGQNYILDYTYFKENGLMSDELSKAYDRYVATTGGLQDDVVNKRIDLNTLNKKKIKLDTDRYTLEENIKGLQSIWSAYVKENDEENATRLATEIKELQKQHAQNLLDTENTKKQIDVLKKEIETLVKKNDMKLASDKDGVIFTAELLEELNDITISDTLTDDYYTTPYSLYNYAKDLLAKRNKLQIEFSLDLVGLLQNIIVKDGYDFKEILKIGNYVNLEDSEIDNGKLRIISYSYSPSDFSISNITFSNNDEDFINDLDKLSDVGRTINKSATYTNNYKTSWVAGKNVNNFVNSMLTDYLDAKTVNIRTKQGRNKYDQSEVGMFIIDALSEGENGQIYIGSGTIAITDDGWLTTKTCIDSGGVIADAIVGKLIAGKNLAIGNENNTMTIDDNGIQIEGNLLKIKGTDGTNKDFNSYLEMVNNSIEMGVKDAKSHTDSQFKILNDSITSKVSKGDEFLTEFKQTTNSFNFTIGNNGTNIKMDKNGINIKNGGINILNKNGEVIIDGSSKVFRINKTIERVIKAGNNLSHIEKIPHGMNYIPAYIAFQVNSESDMGISNTLLPALNIGTGDPLRINSVIRANADTKNIMINFIRAREEIINTVTVKVYILEEKLI